MFLKVKDEDEESSAHKEIKKRKNDMKFFVVIQSGKENSEVFKCQYSCDVYIIIIIIAECS